MTALPSSHATRGEGKPQACCSLQLKDLGMKCWWVATVQPAEPFGVRSQDGAAHKRRSAGLMRPCPARAELAASLSPSRQPPSGVPLG